jgi:pimeloyl-ACP methyl ester carboxylesterase
VSVQGRGVSAEDVVRPFRVEVPQAEVDDLAERLAEWTDPAGSIDVDQLLTDVAVHWFTRTAGASAQLYWETRHSAGHGEWAHDVPTGAAVFPYELVPPTRRPADPPTRRVRSAAVDRVHWSQFDRGGHFPALAVPELFVGDLREFLRRIRS